MTCQTCRAEISKADLAKSALAGSGAWCPKCVKRLKINIKSKEIMWALPKTPEAVPAAVK